MMNLIGTRPQTLYHNLMHHIVPSKSENRYEWNLILYGMVELVAMVLNYFFVLDLG